jgi:hypothetical protein
VLITCRRLEKHFCPRPLWNQNFAALNANVKQHDNDSLGHDEDPKPLPWLLWHCCRFADFGGPPSLWDVIKECTREEGREGGGCRINSGVQQM